MNPQFVENKLYYKKQDGFVGELMLNESVLRIDEFNDYTPLENVNYFERNESEITNNLNVPTLIIGIVFYNEDVTELIRTIVSLEQQIREIRDLCKIQIVIVGDGIQQMDSSVSQFFKECFCKSSIDNSEWDNMINELKTSEKKTFVIQRRLTGDGHDTR